MLNRKGTIINVEQGSSEWLELRRGKITGTSASTVLTFGKGLDTLIDKLVIEMISKANTEVFKSEAMVRGSELESIARTEFEIRNGFCEAVEVGMVQHDRIKDFLVSPDGLLAPYSGIEIKCFEAKNYYEHLKAFKENPKDFNFLEKKYRVQVQACLACTGNDHWNVVIYNPDFEGNEYIQFTIERDEDMVSELEEKIEQAIEMRDKQIEMILNK